MTDRKQAEKEVLAIFNIYEEGLKPFQTMDISVAGIPALDASMRF